MNLGSGRFCIAKFFLARRSESLGYYYYDSKTVSEEEFAVLTGVVVVKNGDFLGPTDQYA